MPASTAPNCEESAADPGGAGTTPKAGSAGAISQRLGRFGPASPLGLRFLLKQILQYAPGTLIPAIIGLLSVAVFTRLLNSGEYGRYSVALSATSLASALATQWLLQGINRYLPGEQSSSAVEELKATIAASLLLITVAGLGLFGIVAFGAHGFVDPEWQRLLWPAGLVVLTTSLFMPLSGVLQSQMRARRYSAYQLVNVGLRFVLSFLLVSFLYRDPASLFWASAAVSVMLLPILWRDAGIPGLGYAFRHWRRLRTGLGRLATYGFPMIGWVLSASLLEVGDRYVIQFFRGSAEVGIYAANYGLVTGAVMLVAAPVLLAANPLLMRAWDMGDHDSASRWLGTIAEWFLVAGILMTAAVSLLAKDIGGWVLGTEFREGYPVMPVLLAGGILWQFGMYAHKPLEFANRTRLLLGISIVAALANLALNFAFVPVFGYTAAAYTTLVSFGLYVVLTAWAGRSVLRWRINWRRIAEALALSTNGVLLTMVARPIVEGRLGQASGPVVAAVVAVGTSAIVLWRSKPGVIEGIGTRDSTR